MYCPNCGKQLPDKTMVCTYCGAPTGEKELIPKQKTKKSTAPKAMSIAGFVVTLIALVVDLSIVLDLVWNVLKDFKLDFDSSIFFLPVIGFVLALVGHLTGKSTAESNSKYKNTYATAGITMGIVSIGFALIYCLVYFTVLL